MITVEKGDITSYKVDAIVNAANSSLLGGGGVDGAIHRKGGANILKECMEIRNKQGGCKTGNAVYTSAGLLKAKYVIHTVGPVWNGGNNKEREMLSSCYMESLKIAESLKVESIAFPNISTGIYHFPKDIAAEIAVATVKEYLKTSEYIQQVYFVCFEDDNFDLYQNLL